MEVQRGRQVFTLTGQPVGVIVMRLDEHSVAEHAHDFLVIEFVVGGSGFHVTRSGAHPVQRGSVVVVRPGVRHTYEVPEELRLVNVCIRTMLLHDELAWVLDFPRLGLALLGPEESLGTVDEGRLQRILAFVDDMSRWLTIRPAPVILGMTSAILSELADVEFSPTMVDESLPISELVREVMLRLVEDPSHGWTMSELAHGMRTSESSLYRQFRSQTGASPLAWLTQFRAETAATLLSQTDLPVAAIGRRVGWADPNYFSRRFREVYGMRPSEHRQRFRVNVPPR